MADRKMHTPHPTPLDRPLAISSDGIQGVRTGSREPVLGMSG